MLIRGHYPDPAVLGNEQVLTPVGDQAERKEGLGEEGKEIDKSHWQAGGRPWLSLCSNCKGGVGLGSGTEILLG